MTHQQVFASEHTSSWFGSIRILYLHTKNQTTSCHFLAQLYLGGSLVVCSKVFPKFTRKSCRSGGKTDCFWKFPVSLSVDAEKAKLMLEMDGEIIADLCGADSLPGGSFKDLLFSHPTGENDPCFQVIWNISPLLVLKFDEVRASFKLKITRREWSTWEPRINDVERCFLEPLEFYTTKIGNLEFVM